MKQKIHYLFMLLLMCLLTSTAWGENVSFGPSNFSGQGTSGSGSAISATVDGVTFACDKGYGTTQIRCYNEGKITISSSNTITAISFTFSGSYTGGLETSYTNLSTTSWEKALTSQARITAVTVYTGGSNPPTYTITYDANGGTGTMTDSNSPYNSGSTVTVLGNSFTREGYTFDSWNTAANGSGTSYDEDDTFSISDNTTLYAQWTENTPAGNYNWVLTDISALTATDVFVIVGNNYAMTNNNGTSSAPAAIKVTVEDGKITTSPEDNIIWTLSGDATNGYTFYPNGSTETWLYCNTTAASGSNNNMRVGKGNRKVFELKNGHLWTKDTYTSRCLSIYSNQDWRGYTSTDNAPTLKFYKRVRANEPTLAASNVELAYDATSGSIAYTLTNASGGTMSATSSADWLTIGSVEETIPFTCEANPSQSERSAIITLTYTLPTSGTLTATATVTQAANPDVVSTIAQVRNQGTGDVQTKGIVTSVIGKTAYIQDDNAAIVVYDSNNDLTVSVGNEIKVRGRLSTFNGLLEITSPTVTILSEGKNVTPEVMTIAEVNSSNNQGWLVKIEDATVTAINDQNVTIAQGDNTIIVRFNSSNDINVSNSDIITLTGNIGCYNTTKQIANPTDISKKELIDVSLTFSGVPATIVINETATYAATANPLVTGITYQSSDENVVSVNANNGEIEAKAIGTATITASYAGDASYKAATASYTIEVVGPVHKAKFSINGKEQTDSEVDVNEGKAITFPSDPETILGKQFVGWTTAPINGTLDTAPETLVTSATMGNADVTYYAVFANVTPGQSETVTDELTRETTGITGSSYTAWSGKSVTSSAVYAGQSAGDNNSIQLRSKDSDSGVISTTSGGNLKKIVVIWESNTTTGRTLNIYGSNSVYNTPADLYNTSKQGTLLGTMKYDGSGIGTTTSLTVDGDYKYIGLRSASGAMYLASISITWENSTPATYSGYCTTLTLAAPTFSLAAGEVEKGTEVTITAEKGATLKYTVGETTTTTESNTATVTVNEDVTIKAVAVKDGVESEEVSAAYTVKAEEPVVEPGTPAAITAGFYTIKNLGNENEKFVNVAGRKTATLVDNAEGMAGTVIQVESDADGIVKTLRSQGVDVPGYATRAMKYVPDVVKLVVEKLHVSGSGEILGETGVDKILDKFNKSVDVNLHVVHADGGYRIYGKTPSMTPVKEFYKENKANVDAKLPGLEQAINDAIATIVDKVGKGESLKNTFKLETIWKRMGWTDYEPGTEEATQVAFLQQVLANEENIWNFAYQTAMFYMEWVEGKQAFQEMQEEAPELMKYWNLAKKVRPNFMYYIVQKDGKVDVISQGNEAILNNDKSTVWALEKVSEFKVNLTTSVEKTVYPTSKDGETTSYTECYGTLYTDFAYKLPEGVTAYKVTGINKVGDKAYVKKTELNSEVVPAQTPVLLIANTDELTLTIAEGGEAVADNQLYGNDYLINEYDINTPQLEGVFNLLAQLSQSTYDKYEYLMRKNAGTVNNKYFFGIAVEGELNAAYKAKTGKEMESSPVRILGKNDNGEVGFFETWNNLAGNEGFMFSEEVSEILMNIVGDVNRDGTITISDVTALVNIILGKATYPADADKYDFEAADVNTDKTITIADVTALVNIILGK